MLFMWCVAQCQVKYIYIYFTIYVFLLSFINIETVERNEMYVHKTQITKEI